MIAEILISQAHALAIVVVSCLLACVGLVLSIIGICINIFNADNSTPKLRPVVLDAGTVHILEFEPVPDVFRTPQSPSPATTPISPVPTLQERPSRASLPAEPLSHKLDPPTPTRPDFPADTHRRTRSLTVKRNSLVTFAEHVFSDKEKRGISRCRSFNLQKKQKEKSKSSKDPRPRTQPYGAPFFFPTPDEVLALQQPAHIERRKPESPLKI